MHEVKSTVGEHTITLQNGRLATQANGSVLALLEGTAVLSTVCCAHEEGDIDYLPLQVEYNEKYYAAGKIPGGFLKREARPKDREILISRLIDRPLRPLFPKFLRRDIQVVPTTLSSDPAFSPDILAINASSAAVMVSDIPFDGPVGAVRVCYVEGQYLINPSILQIEQATLDIVVAGTKEGITMVEGGAKEIDEEILLGALKQAEQPIAELCQLQMELVKLCGKEKFAVEEKEVNLSWEKEIREYAAPLLQQACFVKGKHNRANAIRLIATDASEKFSAAIAEEEQHHVGGIIEEIEQQIIRESILNKKVRTDGRAPDHIRDISCDVAILPRAHGSALFTRGETQALVSTTLGTVYDEQILDDIVGDRRERFMMHYNFPPFSVGETGRLATGRREIGHGELANRSLRFSVPSKDQFPYTIRVVSEVLESNGSSSMATVCGASLSLMQAGVPIERPVAGIAMGLIKDENQYVVLSDILGVEDHLGDMDFKVAGTERGITGFQMDIKIKNIDFKIMQEALEQARVGRLHVLGEMNKTLSSYEKQLSQYAPRILTFRVNPEHLGILIGPSGKTIKSINERFSVNTNIEDDGSITIYSADSHAGEEAKQAFLKLLEEPEVGKVYQGTVKRIVDFGAFIEFLPSKEGLCHISKISERRISTVADVLQINQEIPVKIIEIDKLGRVNLCVVDEQGNPVASQSSQDTEYGARSNYRSRSSGERSPRSSGERSPRFSGERSPRFSGDRPRNGPRHRRR